MLSQYLNTLKNKNVAVIGAGVSNTPLIKMLWDICRLTVHDKKGEKDFDPAFLAELKAHNVNLVLGNEYLDRVCGDIIFRTPGVRPDVPALLTAKENGGIVTSEMDVFFSLCPCPVTAITGSDGKTTTSTLISEMYKAEGYDVFLGGNIGAPLLPRLDEITKDSRVVVELSSFQLMDMTHSPHVAVVTNVTPNHLDYHKGMEEYEDAKFNILRRQKASDRCVLNYDDLCTRAFGEKAPSKVTFFTMSEAKHDFGFDGKYILKDGEKLLDTSVLKIPGKHNIANFMTSCAAVQGDVSHQSILKVASTFTGVEHRIEFVREINGAKYYNDSIASSPTRAAAALSCFENIILIAGGYDKKIPFDSFGELVCEKVDTLLLCGATADKIEAAVLNAKAPEKPKIYRFETLADTAAFAHSIAKSGDNVLFSPACASFDQFPNFAVRGRYFKDLVNNLK